MAKYAVKGMSCAACVAHVEKAVRNVDGVTAVTVSLLTNSMNVEGTASSEDVCAAVRDAGYGASPADAALLNTKSSLRNDRAARSLLIRLILSVCILLPLMWISMGHMISLPVPGFLHDPLARGIAELVLSLAICVVNRAFFISGVRVLVHLATNMDTLVAIGASAAFGYSVYALFADGDLYFESAGMILTLITLGKLLEARAKGRTTSALRGLMDLAPKTAVLIGEDGTERTVPAADVRVGDRFVIRSGAAFPADGIILEGSLSADESALTGESVPVDKGPGDPVSAATICRSGYAVCEAAKVGEDTTLSQIIAMVGDASATKAPIAKTADRVAAVFVPVVLGIAAVTFAVWMIVGKTAGYAIARAISVLVISCPCALGLATPVAIMVGSGVGAKHGILFKDAAALETTGRIGAVALDKTGTLTLGQPAVTDLVPGPGVSDEDLLRIAFSLEKKSEHPLAKAVVRAAEDRGLPLSDCLDFTVFPGSGVAGSVEGRVIRGGNAGFGPPLGDSERKDADRLSAEGKTPLFFWSDGDFLGMIALADTLRPGTEEAVAQLRKMGIRTLMLTGDNPRTAEAIGRTVGADEIRAELKPQEQAEIIRSERENSPVVAMVGDGINDAPALTVADVGIAIGAGTDIAMDAAHVVLIGHDPKNIPAAVRLGRRVLTNIRENLFWAFFYNVIGIPLAAGVWIPVFGWELHPAFGALAMSLSSFCVVMNALRLNLVRPYDSSRDKPLKRKTAHKNNTAGTGERKEPVVKKTVMIIEGMMCGHCEARVKKALESVPGVLSAEVSHQNGTAIVSAESGVTEEQLRKAVTDQGYDVKDVRAE
ncbi:MAG: heavy metal translocating P-type ATPase [Clostridia bacterium]|nr:heavy metal translocating P-type ATPase [Clostridia bacterium]